MTWTDVWGGTFSYYGQPVEFVPDHPDTVFVMGADTVWRSVDFGATWDTVGRATGFGTWCDASVRPDSANILLLGDNMSGIWKSTNGGATWAHKYTTIGEIPSVAIDPLTPSIAYASKFGGGGGILKTTNGGETWFNLTVPSANRDTWWVTCSRQYPGYVYYGTYTGDTAASGIFLSRNYGATWQRYFSGLYPNGLLNYGLVTVDSLTVVALQGGGLYKLQFPTAAHLTAPNGGEFFQSGTVHQISWTSAYLPRVRLEFSTDGGGSWTTIADSLPPSASPYSWTVPAVISASCKVRVADAGFSGTADVSDAAFTVSDALIHITRPSPGEIWYAGSVRKITWSAMGVATARLAYSTDDGALWATITDVAGASGSYLWTIPDQPSSACRIRLMDVTDSLISAESGAFQIAERREFAAGLRVADDGGAADTLIFGTAGGASDGIDASFGETELFPKPPSGAFDARWRVAGTYGTSVDIRDTLGPLHERSVRVCEFQPGPFGYPVSLSWSPESLGTGTYILRDTLTHGLLASVDMRKDSILVIANAAVGAVEIVECQSVVVSFPANGGWSLVSLPVVTGDQRKSSLFPNSTSSAFAYSAGYVARDTLAYGTGYWLKLQQSTLAGGALSSDTVHLKAGWNIIGSLSSPVAVQTVVTLPESLIASSIYGYEGGYFAADSIAPGRGYWVKSSGSGLLVLAGAPPAGLAPRARARTDEQASTLTISDGAGGRVTLRFGEEADRPADELPPRPPFGAFDARFTSSRLGVEHPSSVENELVYPISIQSGSNEIFFSWHVENEEKFTYILSENDDSRDVSQIRLTSDGSTNFTLHKHSSFALKVQRHLGTRELPSHFSLGELYPNPFNPSTRFAYSVPTEARVTIVVYSVLGRVVATLVDGVKQSGTYEQEWNGRDGNNQPVSSGVYYVRMAAGSPGGGFAQVRTVLLMK
jgi:hypothetical protein